MIADASNFYTKGEMDEIIDEIRISGCCITEEEVDDKIASAKTDIESEIPSLDGYATEQWVLDKGYITGVDLSNYATLEDIPDLTDYALKSEIPSLSGYATEQWVEDKHYITGVDLSDYATTAYVNTQISSQTGDFVTGEQLSSYTYSKAVIDSKIASGGTFDPTQYYNKTETDNLLDNKLDVSAYTPTDLSDYYTKSETNNQISSATADMATKTWVGQQGYLTEHQSLSGYATQQWVEDKHYLTEHQDLSNYYNKTEVDNKIASAKTEIEGEIPSLNGYATQQWVTDQHYITGVDLSNYATKSEIPTVPTNVSAFNNDAGYLTEHQSLSAYSTTSEVNNLINQSVSGKVDTTTYNTYTASTQTTINSKADSSTLNNYLLKSKIWCGTESEYNLITNKDSETLYLIHE